MIDSNLGLLLTKPIATGAVATGLSRYMTPGMGTGYDIGFGLAAGLGVLTADLVSKQIGKNQGVVTRSIEERAMEIGLSTTAGLVVKRYVVGQDLYNAVQTGIMIIAADVAGEYIASSFF